MQLFNAIQHLFPGASPLKDFTLRDDGNGPYIETWNLEAPMPTQEELEAAWDLVKDDLAWDPVRSLRAGLLVEADIQINKADDQGKDLTPFKAYRQALRDVTKGPDPLNPVWPTKPF